MALTLVVKSYIIDNVSTADATIATAINTGPTYTHVYGVGIVPLSNTQSRVIVVYD